LFVQKEWARKAAEKDIASGRIHNMTNLASNKKLRLKQMFADAPANEARKNGTGASHVSTSSSY
jgi:crotonobetainyl-CoA:carnitine CoA-transferase CaiB-like acyl-CoA transferase